MRLLTKIDCFNVPQTALVREDGLQASYGHAVMLDEATRDLHPTCMAVLGHRQHTNITATDRAIVRSGQCEQPFSEGQAISHDGLMLRPNPYSTRTQMSPTVC